MQSCRWSSDEYLPRCTMLASRSQPDLGSPGGLSRGSFLRGPRFTYGPDYRTALPDSPVCFRPHKEVLRRFNVANVFPGPSQALWKHGPHCLLIIVLCANIARRGEPSLSMFDIDGSYVRRSIFICVFKLTMYLALLSSKYQCIVDTGCLRLHTGPWAPEGLNIFYLCAVSSCIHCDREFHNLVGRSCGRAKRNTSDVGAN